MTWAVGRLTGANNDAAPFAAAKWAPRVGDEFCFGDGSTVPCPCFNETSAPNEGCKHSLGRGATIRASGALSVVDDTLEIAVFDARPGQTAMLLQGATQILAPFKDGLICTGNPTDRIGITVLDAQGTGSLQGGIAARGNVSPGDKRFYQFWFRDPGGVSPCGSGSNFSPAVELDWE